MRGYAVETATCGGDSDKNTIRSKGKETDASQANGGGQTPEQKAS
ncbi:hypothetical protein SAMN05720606_107142 [Paenibacillus polysaccharolyticus]|uniref:Uncharacterized protein n=1 Tax=Paenibacillus polysaccharolyticus TaxID=582692 RepID=A0A1G5HRA6_9BACL|nr:hypothetical protein [Paenibacillus polysaccharolyticus]SCY65979.1 hypothetical protein SAMN05720606_107142 [Paenibacillus polysaccharolyticus]